MVDISKFFGADGAWKEACDLYGERYHGAVPPEILKTADGWGDGRLAYTLGYLFHAVLKKRSMTIDENELQEITKRKITSSHLAFREGFFRGA